MDFLGLFDPSEEDSDVSSSSGSLGSAGISSPESSSPEESSGSELEQLPDQLPPEPQLGNIEYKLKLVSPSKHRFQHLVTQVSSFQGLVMQPGTELEPHFCSTASFSC